MTHIGDKQLATLAEMGAPTRGMIVPTARDRGLIAKGLLAPLPVATGIWPAGSVYRITPTGLRLLADAMESGRLDRVLKGREG